MKCVVLGGGGHARVLLDSLLGREDCEIVAILDSDAAQHGRELFGVRIFGNDAMLPDLIQQGVTGFIVGIGGAGTSAVRRSVYELGVSHGLRPVRLLHPSAICSARAQLGPGVQILAGSIVNAGARLGANVLVNTGAIIEHDCVLGDHVHVSIGACLAGAVVVGDGAFIGAGAIVREAITIGEQSLVAAGAVVVKDVAPGTAVAGTPARWSKGLGGRGARVHVRRPESA